MLDKPQRLMSSKPGQPTHLPMGDYAQTGEPHQNYWRVVNHNIAMPPPRPVIQPPVAMPMEEVDRAKLLSMAICECISCTMLQVKRPNWMEPPSESAMVDQSTTSDGITIPAGAPGAWTELIRLSTPDRWYGIFNRFGNALEDDLAFTNVDWRILINDRPLGFSQYLGAGVVSAGIFNAQLGDPANPTTLEMPIITKYGDVLSVQARSVNAAAHTGYARVMGWMYHVRSIDGAGDACNPTGMVPLMMSGFATTSSITT